MYLEISPRRCGKTTRLVEAVKHWVGNGINEAVVLCRDWEHYKYLDSLLRKVYGQIAFSFDEFLPYNREVKVFLDEFDHMNNLPILKNGYYVSTLNGIYERLTPGDKLAQLLELNNSGYVSWENNQLVWKDLSSLYIDNRERYRYLDPRRSDPAPFYNYPYSVGNTYTETSTTASTQSGEMYRLYQESMSWREINNGRK